MSHKTADGRGTQEMYSVAPAVFTCDTYAKYVMEKNHQQFQNKVSCIDAMYKSNKQNSGKTWNRFSDGPKKKKKLDR